MRKSFKGYYPPSQDEFVELWNNCIFVLDANVLLNLYRYTQDTSDRLIQILHELSSRLWIPHQAAFEFHENRITVIWKQANAYDEIEESITKTLNKLQSDLGTYQKHPRIDTAKLLAEIESFFEKYRDELKTQSEGHPNLLEDDKLLVEITELLESKVGPPYSQEDLGKLYREADARYTKEIPPGYLDSKKEGERKYGDYVVWRQMISKAQSEKKPIIFVTDDAKDDWWRNFKGKTLGPRPELIAEMLKEASVGFYMYRTDQFMEYARSFLPTSVDQKAIDEVKELSRRIKKDRDLRILEARHEYLAHTQEQMLKELMVLETEQQAMKHNYHHIMENESRAKLDFDHIDGDVNYFHDLSKAKELREQRNMMEAALENIAKQILNIRYKADLIGKERERIDFQLAVESRYSQDSPNRSGPTCVHCGSLGPWNGNICLTCNRRDDGDY